MQRILERGQIESLSHGSIERVRRPDVAHVFADRAERLRALSENHTIGDYLRLMSELVNAQHRAIASRAIAELTYPSSRELLPTKDRLHELPWRAVLRDLSLDVLAIPQLPQSVRSVCERLCMAGQDALQAQAEALLGLRSEPIDAAAAPFVMAALQVCWTQLAAQREGSCDHDPKLLGGCPVCDAPPVASIVDSAGYRYLQCSLCASEWHYVRALCTHCGASKGVSYQSIEGASPAVRAECCDACGHYRKIFYREHDAHVEPLADDIASLALDLLLSKAGFSRSSAHPLLWQT
jgi:FdhE protein